MSFVSDDGFYEGPSPRLVELDSLDVIHSGKDTYPLADRVRAVALERITRDL